MTPEDRKSLLTRLKDVPEWQTALIHEQLAALLKGAAALSETAGKLEQGFADGVLRPERYYAADRSFRRDCNTELFQRAAICLGRSLAALELLSVLADAFPRELDDVAMHSRNDYYRQLEALCQKRGIVSEVLQ